MTSRCPSVVRSPTRAPLRSSSALVATVVPCTMRSVRASSVSRERPSSAASAPSPSTRPAEVSSGVDALFAITTCPLASTAATSVNVPPTSIPIRYMRVPGRGLGVQRALEIAKTTREHDEDAAGELGDFGQERLEVAALDEEQPHVGLGAHGRG